MKSVVNNKQSAEKNKKLQQKKKKNLPDILGVVWSGKEAVRVTDVACIVPLSLSALKKFKYKLSH